MNFFLIYSAHLIAKIGVATDFLVKHLGNIALIYNGYAWKNSAVEKDLPRVVNRKKNILQNKS